MIEFRNNNSEKPYIKFRKKFKEALLAHQDSIEAIVVSSYSIKSNEVDSRFVNLKILDDKKFIFFSNYLSPKSIQFKSHNQVSILIFWNSINTQIRIKGNVNKTSEDFNQKYFENRSEKKNALAISSRQSNTIDSFEEVIENYNKSLEFDNLKQCPAYWGGFAFTPYYFEFWEGHDSRLNRRDVYQMKDNEWERLIIQP